MTNAVQTTDLVAKIQNSGLEVSAGQSIIDKFTPYVDRINALREKSAKIVVTDASQLEEMKLAHEYRMEYVKIRTDADKDRKGLKEYTNKYNGAVQEVYKVIEYKVEPEESRLLGMEKFAEKLEEQRKLKRKEERIDELLKYMLVVPMGIDLGEMKDVVWLPFLESAKVAHAKKIEDDRKAEEARIAKEKADQDEREKVAKENERLKLEALAQAEERKKEQAEAKRIQDLKDEEIRKEKEVARIQKEKDDEALRIAKEEKEKAEADLKAKEKAIADEKQRLIDEKAQYEKDILEAEQKAKNAPDREKILELAKEMRIEFMEDLIEVTSPEAIAVMKKAKQMFFKVADYLEESAKSL